MHLQPSLLIISTLTLTLSLLATSASAIEFQPARIGQHENSLANSITFPGEISEDITLFLRCEAKVLPGGTIEEVGCYGDEKIDPLFYRAVNIGSNSASMTPATVDGENVPVLALFSVLFKQQDDQRLVGVIPNHGTNAQSHGLNYVAPQRYGRGNMYRPRTDLGLLWLDATISVEGRASDISYIETEWSNRETERYAKSYINENRFIPGFVDNAPTEMRFVKPIFGYKNGFMIHPEDSKCIDTLIVCDETSGVTGQPRFAFED